MHLLCFLVIDKEPVSSVLAFRCTSEYCGLPLISKSIFRIHYERTNRVLGCKLNSVIVRNNFICHVRNRKLLGKLRHFELFVKKPAYEPHNPIKNTGIAFLLLTVLFCLQLRLVFATIRLSFLQSAFWLQIFLPMLPRVTKTVIVLLQ